MTPALKEKLTRARASLILDQPFVGALVMRLLLVENNSIPTAAVDGRRILVNSKFIDKLTMPELKTLLAHEVMHCVFAHIGRRGTRDPRKYNKAGDYVINQHLLDAGFDEIKGRLRDDAYKGMTSDHIYSLLPDDPPGNSKGTSGTNPGDPLDDIMDGDEDGAGAEKLTPAEERDWKIAVAQAASAAKAIGKLPASMERFIDGLLKPRVDWRAVLRRFITQRDDADYCWARPNRRMLSNEIYLPSLFTEKCGEIVVAIDTSGSIDDVTLKVFGSELAGILADARPSKVHVMYCDSEINKTVEFGPEDEVKLEAVGGGGTAFKPVADWVEEHSIKPVCLVYLTDLYGPTGFQEPDYPWMWATIGSEEASFGEVLKIEV